MNKILCLDFDGVIHSYTSGWKGASVIPDPPVEGAIEALWSYLEHFEVHIFSSRSNQPGGIEAMRAAIHKWDCQYERDIGISSLFADDKLVDILKFPTEKPPAFVSIDDRCITFTGDFPDMQSLLNFKPWYKI